MLKDFLLGNKHFQSFYEFLFKVAIKGMNYDRGHIPNHSGEKYLLELLQTSVLTSELMIFDVGANVGQYSDLVLNTLSKNFQLHSFEPQIEAFNLMKNISNKPNFHAHHLAMGSKEGELDLFYDRDTSVCASMFPSSYANYNITLNKSQKVRVNTIDNFCKENNIQQIDLLKIDVEGFEIEVLKGCQQLLQQQKIKMIQFEFGLASIKARIFLEDFFTILQGYDIYRVLQNGIHKIEYSEYKELFLTTNYVAIKHNNSRV